MNSFSMTMETCYQHIKHFIQGIGKAKSILLSKEILSEVKLVEQSLMQTNVKSKSKKSKP